MSDPPATKRRKPPITAGFGSVFRRIKKREPFASPPANELAERLFDALVTAAIAKCVEFNIAANRARRRRDEEFLFLSALRGICEDLISLTYFARLSVTDRAELARLLIARTVADGLEAQRSFFAANNPFQPVLKTTGAPGVQKAKARNDVRKFWATRGIPGRDGPTIKDMAAGVGLTFTYDYIYFASSNFVHFNPQALLRTGWGPLNEPFQFSITHLSDYYKAVASFYGAILFVGYSSAFPTQFATSCEDEVARLLDLIEQVHRWPEVVTFEEMNERVPIYFLTHAMRHAFRQDGAPSGILAEVRGLAAS